LVSLEEAIKRAKSFSIYEVVEVEVESLEDALRAAKLGADVIMLDNMTPELVEETLKALKREGLREKVKNRSKRWDNRDVISLGYLTHSVRNFDVSLDIVGRL